MPEFITHDLFGRELLGSLQEGTSLEPQFASKLAEQSIRDAFLLGNQGSDPFFFALFTPQIVTLKQFGSTLHKEQVAAVVAAMRKYCAQAPASQRALIQAYIAGYLGHYCLDSVAHPFIYSQQYAICAAGIPGLDERDGSEVHGLIEADLDAVMLYRSTGRTIRDFCPAREILQATPSTLKTLSALYCFVAQEVFGFALVHGAFAHCVWDMRLTLRALYSPRGIKRDLLGRLERLIRRHSLLQAMATRPVASEFCAFDNHEQATWENPFTHELCATSFAELFTAAQKQATVRLHLLATDASTSALMLDLNFDGAPV